MHVKLVVNSFPRTSETFLFNLVTGLEKQGIKVTVCATTRKNDNKFYEHKLNEWSRNIQYLPHRPDSILNVLKIIQLTFRHPLHFLKSITSKGAKEGLSYFIRLSSLLTGSPDIIHFSFSGLGITFLDCLPDLKQHLIKTVVSCRGSAEKVKPLLDPDRGKKLKMLFSYVDLIHCVSYDMRDGLVCFGLIAGKTFVNYPSIDADKFYRSAECEPGLRTINTIVTTGRLHFQKGYIFALQAMKRLKERGVKFVYHILGEGPDRAMITFAIHELGLKNEVVLHGRVSSLEVMKQLEAADIFLLPSVYEGVANAALEAMAMEIPLVTTDAGGMSEVVNHLENGMIVRSYDGTMLADALEEVLTSPELRKKLSKNGRTTIEREFTLANQIHIFIAQYQKLLDAS